MFADKIINEIEFALKSIRFEYFKKVTQPLEQRKYEKELEAALKGFDPERDPLLWATEQQVVFDALREQDKPLQ